MKRRARSPLQIAAVGLAALAASGIAQAQSDRGEHRYERAGLDTYAQELAASFQRAFAALDNPPRAVIVQRGGSVLRIENVQSVRAVGSALSITDERSQTTIVNPLDVLAMTEDAEVARAGANPGAPTSDGAAR